MKTRCHIALVGGALLAVATDVASAEDSGDELKATPYRPTVSNDGGALFGLNRESPRYGLFAGVTMLVR
jgi:hypothetical protein